MKITIEAEERTEQRKRVEIIFTTLGVEAYVLIVIDGRQYEVPYAEFCRATEAVKIDGGL